VLAGAAYVICKRLLSANIMIYIVHSAYDRCRVRAAPAAPRKGGPPPPPPPPRPGQFFEDKPNASSAASTKSNASSQAELLAQLNRGSEVTSGLKKVTADMKTKNRADRTGAHQRLAPVSC
jgi:hypothetical protein